MSLANKLFSGFLLITSLTVIALLLLWQWALQDSFDQFIYQNEAQALDRIAAPLIEYYRQEGNWYQLVGNERLWRQLQRHAEPQRRQARPDRPRPAKPERRQPPAPSSADNSLRRVSLYQADGSWVIGRRSIEENRISQPLYLEDELVGYLGLTPERHLEAGPQAAFIRYQLVLGLTSGAVAIVFAMLIALLLARHFSQPIVRLRQATQSLRAGKLETRLELRGRDELRQLADDFNVLAETLQGNQRQRREWASNISHELRTPVTILRSQLEAMIDGVFEADSQRLQRLFQELQRLNRLIEDLYQLSLLEGAEFAYQMQRLDIGDLVEKVAERFEARCSEANIHLSVDKRDNMPLMVNGDANRLIQLLDNLLQNSLRYTDAPGEIRIRVAANAGRVVIRIEDTPPAVPDNELEKLFERLYRVEKSRQRSSGGSGLGLALCRAIVESHGGVIFCQPATIGGLAVEIRFDLADDRAEQ